METVASLIREFPIGSLIVILATLWAFERMVTSLINRNKPDCDCERDCECDCEEEDDDDDDDSCKKDRVVMGGEEEG